EREDMLIRLGVVALAALAMGFGGSGSGYGTGPTPPPPPANTIDATPAEAFTPPSITVAAGTTVSFAFGSLGHNVYFDAVNGARGHCRHEREYHDHPCLQHGGHVHLQLSHPSRHARDGGGELSGRWWLVAGRWFNNGSW